MSVISIFLMHHCHMVFQFGIKNIDIADLIDTLLEAADKAWRQANEWHAQPPQFAGDVIMLDDGRRRIGFID